MKQKLHRAIILCTLFFCAITFGQNSGIKGTVVDEKTGQTVPGATVTIKGTKKSDITDSEGNFIIRVDAGNYDLKISCLSYESKEVTDIAVSKDDVNFVSVALSGKTNQLDDVVIKSTKAKQESVKGLLTMQKNSANVSDGISAETIKRTPDKNTSDVLKRISGASIQDNRFVIIRGLNDRYNFALINGAPLPSSEPDRKAFSFDIFPSNMLDNIMITKTASPDLPGEFAGGVVQINTKSVPDKDFQSVTVGSGYNTVTTFKDSRTYKGSNTDWLGYDNGTRALPSTIPSTEIMQGPSHALPNLEVAKSFQSDWSINDAKFKPNTSFQYSIGKHYDFGNKKMGMLFSLSHNITNNYNEISRNNFPSPGKLEATYSDSNYSQQVLTGALGNFSLKLNENNNITFKNILSLNSTDLVVERSGQADVTNTYVTNSNVRWFTSNRIYSGQLNGDHYFTKPKIKVLWNGNYSNIQRAIPNLRRNSYTTNTDPGSQNPNIPVLDIAPNEAASNNYAGAMFFSENKETINGGRLDISKKFNLGENSINELKIGAFIQNRNRTFYSRTFYYKLFDPSNTQSGLLVQPQSTVFSIPNFNTTGFSIFEQTQDKDSYNANSKLNASYVMLDNRYKKFRLVWGVRVEDYSQTLTTKYKNIELNNKQQDILPSANLIFSINKEQNIRLSYSKTVNRPEFRELAPFAFYDFTTQFLTEGNPDLKIAQIQNLDLRYEIYPGKGQLFSFSYFRKNFTNPIELKQTNNKNIKYVNGDSAVNSGVEFEFRSLLSSLFKYEGAAFLDDLTLFSNIAIIKSKVDISSFNEIEKSRPMQGQSPYVFNAGLQYMNKDNGWAVSTNINRVGNRIAISGNDNNPSIWEKARTFVDMQIAKSFQKNKFEVKLNIQNVLAQDLIFYQNNKPNAYNNDTAITSLANLVFTGDGHNDNGYKAGVDDAIWITKFGRTFSLSATYNF
jgi:hypothetical protein